MKETEPQHVLYQPITAGKVESDGKSKGGEGGGWMT